MALWTVTAGVSLAWDLQRQRSAMDEIALIQVHAAMREGTRYRGWNAVQGGVWVPRNAAGQAVNYSHSFGSTVADCQLKGWFAKVAAAPGKTSPAAAFMRPSTGQLSIALGRSALGRSS